MNSLFSSATSKSSPPPVPTASIEGYLQGSWYFHEDSNQDNQGSFTAPHQSLNFKSSPNRLLEISSALPHRKEPQSTFVPWKCVDVTLQESDFENLIVKRGAVRRDEIQETLQKEKRCTLLIGRELHHSVVSSGAIGHVPDHDMQSIPVHILAHEKYSLFDSIMLKSTDAREKRFNVGSLRCSLHGHVLHISFFHGRFEAGDMIHLHCGFYRSYIKRYRVMKSEGCIKIDLRSYKRNLGPLFCKYVHRRKVIGVSNAIFHGPPINLRTSFSTTDNSLQVFWSASDAEKGHLTHIPDGFEISRCNPWIALFAEGAPNYYNLSNSYLQFQYLSPALGERSGHVIFTNVPPEAHEVRLFLEGYYDAANAVIVRDSNVRDEMALEREQILNSVIGHVAAESEESIVSKVRKEMEVVIQQRNHLEEEVLKLRLRVQEMGLMERDLRQLHAEVLVPSTTNTDQEAAIEKLQLTVQNLEKQLLQERQDRQRLEHTAKNALIFEQRIQDMQKHLNSVIVEKKTLEAEVVRLKMEYEERSERSSVDSWSSKHSAQTVNVTSGNQGDSHKSRRSSKLRKNFKNLLQSKLKRAQQKKKEDGGDNDAISVNSDTFSVAPLRM